MKQKPAIERDNRKADALALPFGIDPEEHCAQRISKGGRTLVLPPRSTGQTVWNGGARRG